MSRLFTKPGNEQLISGRHTTPYRVWLLWLIIISLFYVYVCDLGVLPVDPQTDEGRRALVTAEMMLSHDFITPTLYGEPYLNKPPLYNWIIAGSFSTFKNYSAFAFRFPVVVSIFLFGFIIYFFVAKYTNRLVAWMTALAFITNGRILLWDSLQGLIDISYGLLLYTSILLTFHLDQKKKYWLLYLATYFLMALAFLMKGLPAIACQVITLGVYFGYTRRLRQLVTFPHIVGILFFILLLGSYYFIYFQRNDVNSAVLFTRLLTESTDQTIVKFGIWKTLLHLITFPFALLYHFAPWTVLVLLLFRKGFSSKLKSNPFLFFNAVLFLANLTIYWASPRVYARYLFFLVPLLFTVLFHFFYEYQQAKQWQTKAVNGIIGVLFFLLPIFSLLLPYIKQTKDIDGVWVKSIALLLLFSMLCWTYFKTSINKMMLVAVSLVVIRLGFNWFVVEQRGAFQRRTQQHARTIAALTEGRPLFILRNAFVGDMDGMAFTISTQRNDILRRTDKIDSSAFYITDKEQLQGRHARRIYRFENHRAIDSLYVVQFLPTGPAKVMR